MVDANQSEWRFGVESGARQEPKPIGKFMSHRHIIDAVLEVLEESKEPLTSKEIYAKIIERSLYTFKAKDPVSVMRAAIRKHLRVAESGATSRQIAVVERDRFRCVERTASSLPRHSR